MLAYQNMVQLLHFIDKIFQKYLADHEVRHNVTTPYHPQTSGQAKTSNKQIKNILQAKNEALKVIDFLKPPGYY